MDVVALATQPKGGSRHYADHPLTMGRVEVLRGQRACFILIAVAVRWPWGATHDMLPNGGHAGREGASGGEITMLAIRGGGDEMEIRDRQKGEARLVG